MTDRRTRTAASIGLALLGLCACAVPPAPTDGGTAGATAPGTEIPGGGATMPQPPPHRGTCSGLPAPGEIVWTTVLGDASVLDQHTLVDDHAGHVLLARGTRANLTSPLVGEGEVQLAELDGAVRAKFPYGVAVAADEHGNAFVTGSFSAPIDLGLGVLTPEGNVDVFVAELDAKGRIVAQFQLGLCGDGVEAIAVARDGRIAVSGPALGTAVVTAQGKLLFALPYSGKLAFDSHGDLVVAGSFTGSLELGGVTVDVGTSSGGFIAAVDPSGHALWSHFLPGTAPSGPNDVFVTSVAIDAHDHVVIGGYTDGQVDLFGTTITAQSAGESGRVSGGFAAKLDASGGPIWAEDVHVTEVNAVAVAPDGSIALAGAQTGNAGFFRITFVVKLDASGAPIWSREMFPASGYGRGLGVATDACGAVYVSVIALDTPNPASTLRTYVIELAP